eukprot:TRINITY_DN9038_c0_g1_i12.p1 TRINITY_DN9038_c0_g1~~TRINITY_DN9038_c0_g1_i12.p1  ORF type:complete len:639 (+),score=37.49 TRINITY_DN9038_c0_g1_i12:873-2789(+)
MQKALQSYWPKNQIEVLATTFEFLKSQGGQCHVSQLQTYLSQTELLFLTSEQIVNELVPCSNGELEFSQEGDGQNSYQLKLTDQNLLECANYHKNIDQVWQLFKHFIACMGGSCTFKQMNEFLQYNNITCYQHLFLRKIIQQAEGELWIDTQKKILTICRIQDMNEQLSQYVVSYLQQIKRGIKLKALHKWLTERGFSWLGSQQLYDILFNRPSMFYINEIGKKGALVGLRSKPNSQVDNQSQYKQQGKVDLLGLCLNYILKQEGVCSIQKLEKFLRKSMLDYEDGEYKSLLQSHPGVFRFVPDNNKYIQVIQKSLQYDSSKKHQKQSQTSLEEKNTKIIPNEVQDLEIICNTKSNNLCDEQCSTLSLQTQKIKLSEEEKQANVEDADEDLNDADLQNKTSDTSFDLEYKINSKFIKKQVIDEDKNMIQQFGMWGADLIQDDVKVLKHHQQDPMQLIDSKYDCVNVTQNDMQECALQDDISSGTWSEDKFQRLRKSPCKIAKKCIQQNLYVSQKEKASCDYNKKQASASIINQVEGKKQVVDKDEKQNLPKQFSMWGADLIQDNAWHESDNFNSSHQCGQTENFSHANYNQNELIYDLQQVVQNLTKKIEGTDSKIEQLEKIILDIKDQIGMLRRYCY